MGSIWWVLAVFAVAAMVVARGPWLGLAGAALVQQRHAPWTAATVGWLALLVMLDGAAWVLEVRAPTAPPWGRTVAAAGAVVALAAGVGAWWGTALAVLGLGFGEVRAFERAWRRLVRLVEVRSAKVLLGLLVLLLPWPR